MKIITVKQVEFIAFRILKKHIVPLK